MDQQKKCPMCAELILAEAMKCKHCGEHLINTKSPINGAAAVLSVFVPGLGQLLKGHFFAGIMWFVFVAIGYACLILPGIFLHTLCVLSALLPKGLNTPLSFRFRRTA